jgi:hypothetical protein
MRGDVSRPTSMNALPPPIPQATGPAKRPGWKFKTLAVAVLLLGVVMVADVLWKIHRDQERDAGEQKAVAVAFESQRVQERQAMRQVFSARLEARQAVQSVFRGGLGSFTNFDRVLYVKKLSQIPIQRTPTKFRLAWFDYVCTWERFAGYGAGSLIRDGAQVWAAPVDPSGLNDISRRWEKMDTTEAWRAVKRTALEFGIDAPPDL